MKYFTEFMLYALGLMLFVAELTFGLDREIARRDYEKAIQNSDFEKPIIGCLWEYNCEYYTNMLYKSVD